ncbi:hypothetical protein MUTS8_01430 [Escherichia coli]|nr:hypothetical protein MUTS8_01430 [Escherichia coli]
MLINRNIVALFALPFMASATASELSIGAGAAYNESPYRGYNENTKAIPLIREGANKFLI